MPCVFEGEYHDAVWGTPVYDSRGLFSQLSLCTQQCGVSWRIVWNKRLHYHDAFHAWDMRKVAAMTDGDLDRLCDKEGAWAGKLIQNRAKLNAIIHNARQCVVIEDSNAGGLAGFLWGFVACGGGASPSSSSLLEVTIDGLDAPLRVDPRYINDVAVSSQSFKERFDVESDVSRALAATLKHKDKKGSFEPFKFLGSTTLQAFLLQCGLLNGHAPDCQKNPRCRHAKGCCVTKRDREAEDEPTTVARRQRRGGGAAASTDEVWL